MTLNILYFVIYAFIGWIIECIYTRWDELRWVNRGFLHGPFCPIYGFGAVFCIIFLAPLQTNMYIFVPITMLVATSLEYFIGWFFENTFHVTLWTYSHKRYNLHGRICVEFTLLWGAFGIIFVKVIHPSIRALIDSFDPRIVNLFSFVVTSILILDLIVSVAQTAVSTERLENLERIEAKIRESNSQIETADGDGLTKLQAKLAELNDTRSNLMETLVQRSQRLFDAFPTLSSSRFPTAVGYIKEKISNLRNKRP